MITIVNYGMGNLGSVAKAFAYLGVPAVITEEAEAVARAEQLVLPGVGAFGDATFNLTSLGLTGAVKDYIATGRPFLGICLGMQLLASIGEEGGQFTGLGIIPGRARKIVTNEKLPQIGWNQVQFRRDLPLFQEIKSGAYFYYLNSFCLAPDNQDTIAATTAYGEDFCAVVAKGNVYGVQFHPEKSGAAGLQLLRNFAALGERR